MDLFQRFKPALLFTIFLLSPFPLACLLPPANAETPAPFIHWGALSYPDQESSLTTGLSLFRFTEFNGEGEKFNNIDETIGLNLITLSWTEHWIRKFPGWSTNLTFGIGPTRNQPTEWLQNDLIHDRVWGIDEVPVEDKRKETDFTVSASLIRWWKLHGQKRVLFLSAGGQTGSLFHEAMVRAGFRRWSPVQTLEKIYGPQPHILHDLFRPLRLSGMVRGSLIGTGAAFHDLATGTFSAQGSISYGWYHEPSFRPWMEIEVGATFDSGIFNSRSGNSLQERFWTIALRIHPISLETWNDQLNSKDFGPTYGAKIMMDLYFLLPDSWKYR